MRSSSLGLTFVICLAGLASACAADRDDCANDSSCQANPDGGGGTSGNGGSGGTSGTGGQGGQAGVGGTAGTDGGSCDPTKSPSEEGCLIDDAYAVFVDGTASTSGDGSKASPFKTIAEGVAAAAGKLVLVCDTTYDEQVQVNAATKMYGGFKCADWTVAPGERAVVKPAAQGYALEVSGVTGSVVIGGMEFDAADGSAPGDSSIAAFVHGSSDVQLEDVKLVAGKGVKGADGTLTPFTMPAVVDLNGNPANLDQGGKAKPYNNCPGGGTTTGGVGGSAPSQAGGPGTPDHGAGQGGTGTCNPSGTGANGGAAPAAADASGGSTPGTLTASGFTPSNGGNGASGGPGQGGGGGAADLAGGGGSGGAGGCGGAGGSGGKGGGASIALLVLDSVLSIDASSELLTDSAGDGGKGAAGQAGMASGGNGGFQSTLGGCQGGKGGGGGKGAAGGGGAGGISVPIVWKGTAAPTVDGATLTPGTKGNKGVGGNAGSNDGIDGVSQPTLEVQ